MESKLDLTKPVQLRDGTPCRIICTDLKYNRPLVVAIRRGGDGGEEEVGFRHPNGRALIDGYGESALDVINVKTKKTKTVALFKNKAGLVFPTDNSDYCRRRPDEYTLLGEHTFTWEE